MCVCRVIIKGYFLPYLLTYLLLFDKYSSDLIAGYGKKTRGEMERRGGEKRKGRRREKGKI